MTRERTLLLETSRRSGVIGVSEQAASRQPTTTHLHAVRVLLQNSSPSILAQRDEETTLTAPRIDAANLHRPLEVAGCTEVK